MAQLNQEAQQLYSALMDRMRQGTEMHEKLADYYNFLNLPGYQKCHEYQMLCELLTYQKAKNDYMKEFNQLVQPNYMNNNFTNMAANNTNTNNNSNNNNSMGNMNNMMNNQNYAQNVIPQNWYKYTRYDVDSGTKRSAVKDGFMKWLNYEKETKQFLSDMAKQLDQMGERENSRKLDYLIDHVEKEIEHCEQKLIALENTGYDMNYILQEQEPLKAKYAEKIRKLNMRDYQYRGRGMGNYANYNYDDDEEEMNDSRYTYHNYRHLPPMYNY